MTTTPKRRYADDVAFEIAIRPGMVVNLEVPRDAWDEAVALDGETSLLDRAYRCADRALEDDELYDARRAYARAFIEFVMTRACEAEKARLVSDATTIREASERSRDWLTLASYVLPKSLREPWLGDLREDRARMAHEGVARRWIFWATVGQLTLLALHALKDAVCDLVAGSFKSAG